MHCDWSSRVLCNSTRHAAYVWCVPYNSTYARKPRHSFLSLKILRRFFQTAIMAEEFPSFDLGFDFLNDQNNEEAASAYLFQIPREKTCARSTSLVFLKIPKCLYNSTMLEEQDFYVFCKPKNKTLFYSSLNVPVKKVLLFILANSKYLG